MSATHTTEVTFRRYRQIGHVAVEFWAPGGGPCRALKAGLK
ncbi:MAG: hypothetical protein K0R38_7670 [Polyangiaceae bacterium]|jgi:hypothetical protein|nr:hypothetical protein [Polyangiaceae bacterium]